MRLPVILLLLTVVVFGTVHFLALEMYLYWQYLWFDIPMHFLGGTVVALTLFALRALGVPLPPMMLQFWYVLFFVLIAGIAWELLDLLGDIMVEKNYLPDTILDLLMDLIGGTVGYFVGSRTSYV